MILIRVLTMTQQQAAQKEKRVITGMLCSLQGWPLLPTDFSELGHKKAHGIRFRVGWIEASDCVALVRAQTQSGQSRTSERNVNGHQLHGGVVLVEQIANHFLVFLVVNGTSAVRHDAAWFQQLHGIGNELALVRAKGLEFGHGGLDNGEFGSESERAAGWIQQDAIKGFWVKSLDVEKSVLGGWFRSREDLKQATRARRARSNQQGVSAIHSSTHSSST